MKTEQLKLTEIFYSIQGESSTVGIPTVFIRLTGCPLRCQYCDTAYAFHGGEWWSFDKILAEINRYHTQYITITGGEPLAQKNVLALMKLLCDKNYFVSLETSGALDISQVDRRVMIVMDLKTPGSGEERRNLFDNIKHLKLTDEIKFVICNRADYDWAKAILKQFNLNERCKVLFSPSYQQINPQTLADWILQDQLPIRFQLQLHKAIWGDVAGK